jgi:hypothetical protein
MYEEFRNRMSRRGSFMGETMRLQSDAVVNATWMNSVAARRVQVVWLDHGLPPVYDSADKFPEPLDAHFEMKSAYSINSGESPYYLTFRPGELAKHPEIKIGAYVSIPNVDNVPEWWMIVFIEDDNELKKLHIMKCNWKFGWVVNGKIYYHLGVLRNGSATSEADANSYTTIVSGNGVVWMATNADTQTLQHGQRLLISDKGRMPPLCYNIGDIIDTRPIGLTKFVLSQGTYDATHDNAELMLANYYDFEILPEEPVVTPEVEKTFGITYNGTKPTIKVGSNAKIFTAQLPADNYFDIKWSMSDGANTYGGLYDNYTKTFGDYTMTTQDRIVKISVANNYNLIGTILTVYAECADGSVGSIQVEVVG